MKVVLDSGAVINLGETEATPTISITDYSRRVTDDFGVTTVVERGFSRRLSVRLALPFDSVSTVQQRLADLRATSALWVASDRLAWLSVHGFYKDFDLDHAVPPLSYCTLTVEGLAETSTVVDDGSDPAPVGTASTLRLLQPGLVDDRVLASSSVAENDYPEWSATVVYPLAARIIKTTTHRVYESVAGANVGNDPNGVSGKWLDIGPTNRWAMFDQALGSVTSAANAITVALDVTGVDALALLDVTGATARVQAPGYDRTIANTGAAIMFTDLPNTAVRVTVTITGPGPVSVGTLLVGRSLSLGITEASPTAGITDYSRKVVDDFGEVTVVQRAWSKRMSAKALIRTDAVDIVANRIAAVRALPSLWIGQAGLDSLTVYGFFKNFSIEVGLNVSKLSLSIEGLSKAPPLAAPPEPPVIAWPDITDPEGTKPDDNATVGAPGNTPVGGVRNPDGTVTGARSASDVVADLDINTLGLLSAILNGDELNQLLQAMATVAGQPVNVAFLDFKGQQLGVNAAQAYKLSLLGAQAPDGTSFILDLNRVLVSPAQSLAQRLTEISASNGGISASVALLLEALVNDGGAFSKAILRTDADGVFGAFAITADGVQRFSRISLVADELEFVDVNTDGGPPIKALYYADGKWQLAENLYVKNLFADTVTTDNIVSSAVQQTKIKLLASPVNCPRGATTAVASITFTKDDADSLVKMSFSGNFYSPDDLTFTASWTIDGMTSYQSNPINLKFDQSNSQAQMPLSPFYYLENLSAGSHTVSFSVFNNEDQDLTMVVRAGSALEVLEIKKGAM